MHAQLRATRVGLKALPQVQRRLLATPPTPIVTVTGIPPPPPSGALPVRPVVVTATTVPPTPGSSSLPPPPPPPLPPPPPPRRFFRKFLIYTAVGVLTFYPLSGYLSTKNETYRELFTQIPGGEAVADYADDNHWENFGVGTVSKKAVQGWQGVTGDAKDKSVDVKNTVAKGAEKAGNKLERAGDKLERAGDKVERAAKKGGEEIKGGAIDLRDKAVHAAQEAGERAKKFAEEATEKAKNLATEASEKAKSLANDASNKASRAATEAKNLASDASARTKEAAAVAERKLEQVPAKFSEGVEGLAKQAENALHSAEDKAVKAVHSAEDKAIKAEKAIAPQPTGPRSLPDTQRPRELRPETVKPTKMDPTLGKEKYNGPALPLGFEPPPGYYIAAPKKPEQPVEGAPLPLLAPKVKDFASEEPIIAQLASTIDSLTSSLSKTGSGSANATGILTKAHDDLSALSTRLGQVKKSEKEKLEKTIKEKTAEFETLLKTKAEEAKKGEQGLKAGWEQERQSMVDKWRGELEGELETQRTGIDKRLREEVVSQGIELQRRWLRSIKTQVETERGGRLAKLDQLTTSLKQLERITLDNSATLDENVRVNKVWSALRALQSKTDLGDVAFDHELRVLKSLTLAADTDSADKTFASVISPALKQIEASGAATTGVKSFASLSSWFSNSVAPKIHSASLTPTPEESTVVSHLASIALSKIMFRPKAGVVSGDDVGAVLARAEWCLGEKDLDGAAREINGLKGWPGKLAGDWLREARRKLEVQQALEVVMTEATLESLLLS